MRYQSFTRILFHVVFLFYTFKAIFSLYKGNGLFSPLPPSMIFFSMGLIDFLIAHECDHSFVLLLPSAIQSQAFVFSPFGGWQGGKVAGWQRSKSMPPRMRIQNGPPFIIYCSSPGDGSRGGGIP